MEEELQQSSVGFFEPVRGRRSPTLTDCQRWASKGRNSYFLALVLSSESYLVVIGKVVKSAQTP